MELETKYLNQDNPIPLRIAGEKISTSKTIDVVSPFSQQVISKTYLGQVADIENAIAVAKNAFGSEASAFERSKILDKAANLISQYQEGFAQLICQESAKPIKTARIEVDRAIETFKFSASAARSNYGEMVNLDAHPSGSNKIAFTMRSPIGVVAAITPFNFPMNLVAHKVAPAIAVGAPLLLKPSTATPLSAAALVDLLIDECGLNPKMITYIPCSSDVASRLAKNDDVAMISFTGSPQVGWSIKQKAYKKKVALELGNNTPVIIEPDADLEKASELIATSGYSFQGQSCISVQRVFAHSKIKDEFVKLLKAKVQKLKIGDPALDSTDVSALITPNENQRIKSWIQDAVEAGAKIEIGGEIKDNLLLPSVLTDVTDEMDVCKKEVFGPVVSILTYDDLDHALVRANDSTYGLQASIFTNDISKALNAAEVLDYGGVLINETPTYRADNMPYGGRRDSGNTKEGPLYTMREMTQEKLIIIAK